MEVIKATKARFLFRVSHWCKHALHYKYNNNINANTKVLAKMHSETL